MLSAQLCDEVVKARGIAAWPSKTGDETEFDRIPGDEEHNWNRGGRPISCACCRDGACDDPRHLPVHKLRRHLRQPIVLPLGPAVLDRHVAPLDVTGLGQPPAEYHCA